MAPSLAELTVDELKACGLSADVATALLTQLSALPAESPSRLWPRLTQEILRPKHPLALHRLLHDRVFQDWDAARLGPPPAWFPTQSSDSNLAGFMEMVGVDDYSALHAWSVEHRSEFWRAVIDRLGISFRTPPSNLVDLSNGVEQPRWLPEATMNIVDSCFTHDGESVAVIEGRETDTELRRWTLDELRSLVAGIADGLRRLGLKPGDRVAIDMPMRTESVAIYLAAVAMDCPVVTIADSFAANEIETRLRIAAPQVIFTQDEMLRGGKRLPLFEKVVAANAPRAVVLPCETKLKCELRATDLAWDDFLGDETELVSQACSPRAMTTILFSSGTTGNPKAIPWDHTTPLKCAADAHLHHDVQPGDVVCWPSNMGWMMGPWLVFAALINRATIALYDGAPTTVGFAQFVEQANVTMLGLVPSLISAWRAGDCLRDVDWTGVRVCSSTGECSNPDDMFFLMTQTGYKPIIEYCGGTEIGGGYIASTVVQPSAPSTFSTPTLGIDLVLIDEAGSSGDRGEVYLIPPSIGMSQTLLNGDHHQVYYAGAPVDAEGRVLRRHGDELERLPNGYYRAHGRADDAMNLGGIKVSSLQIEEVVNRVEGVRESAAIAVPPAGGGPDRLVVYTVADDPEEQDVVKLRTEMQQRIRTHLNPLFKLHEVVMIAKLPRTASNKVMRRVLRSAYQESETQAKDT